MLRMPRTRPEGGAGRSLSSKRQRQKVFQLSRHVAGLERGRDEERLLAPRRAREVLRESEARYRALVESQDGSGPT